MQDDGCSGTVCCGICAQQRVFSKGPGVRIWHAGQYGIEEQDAVKQLRGVASKDIYSFTAGSDLMTDIQLNLYICALGRE